MSDWHLNSHRRQAYDTGNAGAVAAAVIGNEGVRCTSERFVGAQVTVGTVGTGASTVTVTKIRTGTPTVMATMVLGIGENYVASDINNKDGEPLAQGDIIQFEVTVAGADALDIGVTAVTHITRR